MERPHQKQVRNWSVTSTSLTQKHYAHLLETRSIEETMNPIRLLTLAALCTLSSTSQYDDRFVKVHDLVVQAKFWTATFYRRVRLRTKANLCPILCYSEGDKCTHVGKRGEDCFLGKIDSTTGTVMDQNNLESIHIRPGNKLIVQASTEAR